VENSGRLTAEGGSSLHLYEVAEGIATPIGETMAATFAGLSLYQPTRRARNSP
jgi:hypothetical protein